jgi:hypothetical protein
VPFSINNGINNRGKVAASTSIRLQEEPTLISSEREFLS